MASSVVKWVSSEMSRLLGVETTDEVAHYVLKMEDRQELEEYMCDLMDTSVPDNQKFIDQLLSKWQPPNNTNASNHAVPSGVTVYNKYAGKEDDKYAVSNDKGAKSKKKGKGSQAKGNDDRSSSPRGQTQNGGLPNKTTSSPRQQDAIGKGHSKDADSKKKSKFTPLFSAEGQAKTVAKLPGRHACECQALKHGLINNCTKCGRIVCEQEGSGPCLFCGALVCTKEEQEILNRGSKKSDKLRSFLLNVDKENQVLPSAANRAQEGLDKALQHRDRLLDYDKTSVKRTQVIDDESDYFSTGPGTWLSNKEKEMLEKREAELRAVRFASRKDRKVTLDFAGRQVVDSKEPVDMYNLKDSVIQEVHFGVKAKKDGPDFSSDDFTDLVNPNITQEPPKFDPKAEDSVWHKKSKINANNGTSQRKTKRLQDKEHQEMADDGMAMSMHQPWASLLVAGIKMHEGRSWYTAHRGRLWIAATAKKPEPLEIAQLEQNAMKRLNNPDLPFPENYPEACLLGCVDVVDCLPQEEYRERFPDGESMSPYVFICETPQELFLKFPLKGKHKIYKLDSPTHNAAKKGLLKQYQT